MREGKVGVAGIAEEKRNEWGGFCERGKKENAAKCFVRWGKGVVVDELSTVHAL